MRRIFAKLALCAMMGVAGAGALALPAAAGPFADGIEAEGFEQVQYRHHEQYGDERDWDRGGRHHRPGWGRDGRGQCAPWIATEKARDFGLHRVRVVDISPRRVVVEGRRHGDQRTVVFANVGGCPLIRR